MISTENGPAREGSEAPENERLELVRTCRRSLKRLAAKLEKQEREVAEADSWVLYRQVADSLLAAPNHYPRGTASCRVANLHTGSDVEIGLNPKFDACRNAGLLYKKARKGERGAEIAREQAAATRREIALAEKAVEAGNALRELDPGSVEFAQALESFRAAVALAGAPAKQGTAKGGREGEERVPYRHYLIDGFDVYIGKTETQNDELTTRFARPWDVWLHVAAHSGSHVVMRRAKGADWPPKAAVEKVAALAVWFSKARHTSYAEVNVTEARFVRKPRKAPPGQVIAERCRAVRVSPISPEQLVGSH